MTRIRFRNPAHFHQDVYHVGVKNYINYTFKHSAYLVTHIYSNRNIFNDLTSLWGNMSEVCYGKKAC